MLDQRSVPSSRLVKRERKKLLRQTVIFGGVAILIVLGFLFVVLPVFIRFLNTLFGSQSFQPEDTLPPSPPTFSAPVAATHSAQLQLKGFAEPKSKVVLVLNGEQQDSVTVGDDGSFGAAATLTDGENTLSAFAVDEAGNESNASKAYTIILDTEAPALEITSPEEGATIVSRTNQDLKIVGTTEPESKVYVNDRVVFPDAEGAFTYTLRLNEGENKINIRVVDRGGNTSEKVLTVTFTL